VEERSLPRVRVNATQTTRQGGRGAWYFDATIEVDPTKVASEVAAQELVARIMAMRKELQDNGEVTGE
jgi:hypothetical protein